MGLTEFDFVLGDVWDPVTRNKGEEKNFATKLRNLMIKWLEFQRSNLPNLDDPETLPQWKIVGQFLDKLERLIGGEMKKVVEYAITHLPEIVLSFSSHLTGSVSLKIKKGKIHNRPFFMVFSNCTRNILHPSFPLINALPHWYARTKIAVPYDANPNDCMGCDDEDCPCPGEIWKKLQTCLQMEIVPCRDGLSMR